jgi:hypothetical protein
MLAMPKAHEKQPITAEQERDLSLTLGEEQTEYVDPIAKHDPKKYSGKLLAAAKPVVVFGRKTGWAVIVQQKRDNILEPVYSLSGQLQRQALAATVFVLIALAAVWGFVLLTLQGHSRSRFITALRQRFGLTSRSGSGGLTASGGKSVRRSSRTAHASGEPTDH